MQSITQIKDKQRELFAQMPPKKNQYVDFTRTDYSSPLKTTIAKVIKAGNATRKEISSYEESINIIQGRISQSKNSLFVDMTADNSLVITVPKNSDGSDIELLIEINGRQVERNIIILEENSKASLTLQYSGDGFLALTTDIIIEQGAELNFSEVQELGRNSTLLGHTEVKVHKDAKIHWNVITLGAKTQSMERHIQLLEPGADGKLVEVFFGNDNQLFDNNVVIGHKNHDTTANALSNGILTDSSRNVFFGLIKIDEKAQKTNSFLAQHTMLLSPNAICNSIPSLEIAANDVKASHSASAGQIDQEQVFYLMARGIPFGEAKKLIVFGFLESAIARIPSDEIKNRIKQSIESKWSA
ncbi:MAG TPA: Fe-S cluster assembly protein SufD [Candidatus Nanoarchaeia archaeon]|nr:Fe-S cluster assembly protein SufD [Candidatus Nanoarchaeia archaeon]